MRILKNKSTLLVSLLIVFSGCAPSIPNLDKQKKDVLPAPTDFSKFSESETQKGDAIEADQSWKKYFSDLYLTKLIDTAMANNQELNIINQEIKIAENEIMARDGEVLPNLGFGAGAEVENVGEYTSKGVTEKLSESEETPTIPEKMVNRRVGLYASWEVDIWKKLRNASKSAYYNYLATIEGRRFVTTQIVSEVASSYYELLSLDRQLEIVNRYIKNLKKAQDLVTYQQQAAKVTSLAVNRFAAEVLKNESRKYDLQQQIVETENKINALLGRYPQPIQRPLQTFETIIPKNVYAGVPSSLLENRPDVKQASLELEAAKLDVEVAKARFYPSLSIEAGVGYESFNNKHFIETPQSLFYNAAANLTAPLLNRQGIKADYFSANNKQVQAIYEYEKTLITAYTEVVNHLSKIQNLDKIFSLKSKQVAAMKESVSASRVLFKAARVDYVEALLTQRESLEAQIELVEVKKQQLVSYVNLYQSLGGGWR